MLPARAASRSTGKSSRMVCDPVFSLPCTAPEIPTVGPSRPPVIRCRVRDASLPSANVVNLCR